MSKTLVRGVILVTLTIVAGLLFYTSPDWYGRLTEEINKRNEERAKIELIKEQKRILLEREKDSLKRVDEKRQEMLVEQTLDSLNSVYNEYFVFLNKTLERVGSAETKNYVATRRFNEKDSCFMLIVYLRESELLSKHVYRLNNGTEVIYLEDYQKDLIPFTNKRIFPSDGITFSEYEENNLETFPKMIELLTLFKAEYLVD